MSERRADIFVVVLLHEKQYSRKNGSKASQAERQCLIQAFMLCAFQSLVFLPSEG